MFVTLHQVYKHRHQSRSFLWPYPWDSMSHRSRWCTVTQECCPSTLYDAIR